MIARISGNIWLGGSALAIMLACVSTASAQEQPPADEQQGADRNVFATDPIIVTARRRVETAQDVPIALTVLSGAQVTQPGTIGLTQVAQLAPSLQLTATNPRQTNINIRGLGATPAFASLGLEYGVGVYVDQVYYSRPTQAAFDLYDLERVEVLRGPQGTLFGKNTTAGAINIVTQEPSFTPSGRAEISLGNYRSIQARATATAPLTDTVAVRLSMSDTVRDKGFQTVASTGKRVHDLYSLSLRGQVLFEPGDAFRLRLTGDYSSFEQDCCQGPTTTIRTTRIDGSALPNNFLDRIARFGYETLPVDPFARRLETNRPFDNTIKTYGAAAIADLDLGAATVTSVTGWRKLQYRPSTDGDLTGLDIFVDAGIDEDQEQFSQELRIASNGVRTLDYVAGLYYFWQRIDDDIFVKYGEDAALWILGPAPGSSAASIGGQAALNGLFADGAARASTNSYAIFGEATYHIGELVDVTGGLRYTKEDKTGSFAQVQRGPELSATEVLFGAQAIRNAFAPAIAYDVDSSEDNLTGRATIAVNPSDDLLVYATYARGFKSGGLNLNATTAPRVIEPEKVEAYELGIKAGLLDQRLTINLAAFTQDIDNYQSQQIDTAVAQTAYIANVGSVRSRGVEADANLQLSRSLRLFASGAYTDASYRDFLNAPCPVEYVGLQLTCDLSGRRLPGVSKYSAAMGGKFSARLDEDRMFYVQADHSYRSDFYTTYNLAADSLADGYHVTNARIGVRDERQGWDLSLFARNLFDSEYVSIINPSAFNTGQSTAILGDPRTYGVTFRITS
ncbi:TonB-dependent receptor [Croceicoccus sp. F390]|uniref:TonB-dependent receptor n=1 Tax=Croceicoccus esteveae TaxID=3075597 RepID=A0ABU2ZIL7_9SPHN|nr:TonB-dependent receptor [Croceicoccus sp. F390]MDT0575868.1 TonB-dependent receptor [Croceicoccus sp. F390]